MLKRIFEFTNDDGQPFSLPTKEWIAKVIGGAVVADGIIQPEERVHLESLFDLLKNEPEAQLIIREVIKSKAPPAIETVEVTSEVAEEIFKCILEICASDHEIKPREIQYINEAAMALGIDTLRAHHFLNIALRKVKIEFFNKLSASIHGEERIWLASVILKSIYADGRVDSSEIPYLNDVYQLVGGNVELLEEIKKGAKSPSLTSLPKIFFEKDLATEILRYLLEITMGDQDIDAREVEMVRQISYLLRYDEEELEKLIDRVEQVKFFMRASSELVSGVDE